MLKIIELSIYGLTLLSTMRMYYQCFCHQGVHRKALRNALSLRFQPHSSTYFIAWKKVGGHWCQCNRGHGGWSVAVLDLYVCVWAHHIKNELVTSCHQEEMSKYRMKAYIPRSLGLPLYQSLLWSRKVEK